MPAPASKIEEWVSPMKSEDTTWQTQSTPPECKVKQITDR